MKNSIKVAATAALSIAAGAATAGGLDRTGSPVDVLFEDGNYAELSFGYVQPSLSGTDLLGNSYSGVGKDFGVAGAAVKLDFGGDWSFALIYDQPYGADTFYSGDPTTTLLAGTKAEASTHAVTTLLKYQATDRISFYGGPRMVKGDGEITLSGQAYSVFSGYRVKMTSDSGVGYVLGAAYEIPDIALRAALTYHSEIDINFGAVETIPTVVGGSGQPISTGTINTVTPQSIALDLQSGIAKDTLLFGGVRWTEWSAFTIVPPLANTNLAEFDDVYTWELGIGRKFSDKFSASLAVTYEHGDSSDLVSPLAPSSGQTAISLGGKYKVNDMVSISGGIRYTMLGDAIPETGTPDTPRGNFTNNDAISAGLKIGLNF